MKQHKALDLRQLEQKRKRRRKLLAVCMLLVSGTIFLSFNAAAADDIATITTLERMGFPKNGMISYMFRWLGWLLIKGLHFLVDGIEDAVYGITDVMGTMFNSPEISDFIVQKIVPLALGLLALVVVFVGIQYLIKPQDSAQLIRHLITGIVIAVGLPVIMSGAFQMTQAAIQSLGGSSGLSTADQAILDNVTDNLLYDKNNFGSLTDKSNYAKTKDGAGILRIDPVELVDAGKTDHPDVWGKDVAEDSNGNKTLEKFDNGMIKKSIAPLTDAYYRWSFDWLSIFVTLLVSAAALLMMGIKVAKLLFDLIVQQVLAQVLGLLDVYSQQRLKKCLQSILGSFVTLFGCFAMLQVYMIGMRLVANHVTNLFVKIFFMIALALLLIGGPNIFVQLFGQDLGGQRGALTGALMGMNSATHLAGAAKRGLVGSKGSDGHRHGGLLPGAAKTADKAIGTAGGAVAGVAGGLFGGDRGRAAAYQKKLTPSPNAPPINSKQENSRQTAPSTASAQTNPPTDTSAFSGGFSAVPVPDVDAGADSSATSTRSEAEKPEAPAPDAHPDLNAGAPSLRGDGQTLGGSVRNSLARKANRTQTVQRTRRMYDLSYNSAYQHQQKKSSTNHPSKAQNANAGQSAGGVERDGV